MKRPSFGPAVSLSYPEYSYGFSEFIGIGKNGHLWVEGRDCVDLAKEFGTPLHILSEGQLRHNYRRFKDAFQSDYPDVEILFANKSNNALAVRHIMNQEGAGGDCFGFNEMYLALLAGSDPGKMVLNGSNKEPDEIELAIANGVCINIDAMDELDIIKATAARLGRDVEVGIRVKPELPDLEDRPSNGVYQGSMAEIVRDWKWGMPYQPVEKGVIDRVSRHGEAYRGEGGFAILGDDEDDLNDQDGSSGRNKHEQGANSARHGLLRGAGADELAHQQR